MKAWIEKHGKRYRVRWREGAVTRSEGPFDRKRDADTFLLDLRRRAALGGLYEAPSETFGTFADGWLTRYERRVSPSSFRRTLDLKKHLEPYRDIYLDKLTVAEVEDDVLALAKTSPRQAQMVLATVKKVVKDAKSRKLPVNEDILGILPPRTSARTMGFLTWDQVDRLALYCGSYNNLIYIAALTGLRQDELLSLTDEDFLGTQLRVGKSKTRAGIRNVDLSPKAQKIIKEQLLARKARATLIFPAVEGGRINPNNFRNRIFDPARIKLGVPDLRFHDLRHTYASLMIAAGAEPKYLQSQMGHKSIKTTYDRYGHLFPQAASQVLSRMDTMNDESIAKSRAMDSQHPLRSMADRGSGDRP